MSRPLRIEYPGAWYHVMNGGRRSENIFLNPADYDSFIELLRGTIEKWNMEVAGYCLMPTNYHLLAHIPDGNLSRCMRHINGVYTQRFNRHHNKDCQLFRGRYKAVLIEPDSHLLDVLRYIHRTPLREGVTREVQDHLWTSHHGYVSSARKYRWLQKEALLSMFLENFSDSKAAYMNFISWYDTEKIRRFYSLKNPPSVLGSYYFEELVKENHTNAGYKTEMLAPQDSVPIADSIISAVCDHFHVKKESLTVTRRGRENLPRNLAIYLVSLYCRESLADVGKHFSIINYSTVSNVVERIRKREGRDRNLQKNLEKIIKKIPARH